MKRLTTNSSVCSIGSYQASSGRPSCSSISGSSSNVGGHSRKCKRCGQKFFLISPNRHSVNPQGCDVDSALQSPCDNPCDVRGALSRRSNDGQNNTSSASSPRPSVPGSGFFSALKSTPLTRSSSGVEGVTATSLRNGGRGEHLRKRYCEKCFQQKHEKRSHRESGNSVSSSEKAASNNNVSPPSSGMNGFRNATNVFSFIRYTLSRILEPKASAQEDATRTLSTDHSNLPAENVKNEDKKCLFQSGLSSCASTKSTVASTQTSSRPGPPNSASLQYHKATLADVNKKVSSDVCDAPSPLRTSRSGARLAPRPTAMVLETSYTRKTSATVNSFTAPAYCHNGVERNAYFNSVYFGNMSPEEYPSGPLKINAIPSPSTTGVSDCRSQDIPSQHVMLTTPYTHINIAGIGACDEHLVRARDFYSNSSGIPTTHTSLYASNHYSPTGSHMSLATTAISSGTPNEYQPICDLDHFLDNLPTCPSNCSDVYGFHSPVDMDMLYRHNPRNCHNRFHIPIPTSLGAAYSCPSRSEKPVTRTRRKERELLCSTWPTAGKRLFPESTDEEFSPLEVSCFSTRDELQAPKRRSASDFNIPFDDIKLLEVIKTGKRKSIYRGRWHGEVMVHLYDVQFMETRKYWEVVEKLMTIRHENIDLFMGAAFEPTRCCVVTSARTGVTLYEKLHVAREKTSLTFKLQVMRQLAQAIGYLHARTQKPIYVRRLTSRCVFLEPKTVLTLLDYENAEDLDDPTTNQLSLSQSFLYYAAPELLKSSTGNNPRMVDEENFDAATDVFAFGTIVFELMANRYPLQHLEPEAFIEAVCSGQRGNYKDLKGSDIIKGLLKKCWTHSSHGRPFFRAISEELMHGQAAHKRHSSSEPENLHRNSVFYPSQFDI